MMFWVFSGGLTLMVLLVLSYSLMRKQKDDIERSQYDSSVYCAQLEEIDRELERQEISEKEANRARIEVERRLLQANSENTAMATEAIGKKLHQGVVGLSMLGMAGGAFALYFLLGVPGMPDFVFADRGQEIQKAEQAQKISKMVERLAKRLKDNPLDPGGWAMLGRSYRVMDRLSDSRQAYGKAYELEPQNTEYALDYMETMVFENDGKIPEAARDIIRNTLEQDPKNFKARFYYALDLTQSPGGHEQAIAIWKELLNESPKDAPWVSYLEEQIEQFNASKTVENKG